MRLFKMLKISILIFFAFFTIHVICSRILILENISNSQINSFISEMNRLAIFLFGSTVTANVYLQNVKNKISASYLWNSKQSSIFNYSLVINFLLLISGTIVLHFTKLFKQYFFKSDLVKHIMNFLEKQYSSLFGFKLYLILVLVSLVIYVCTLYKFIEIFNVNKGIDKHSKKLLNSVYIRNPYTIFVKEKEQLKNLMNNFEISRIIKLNTKSKKNETYIPAELKIKITRKFYYSFLILIQSLFKKNMVVHTRYFSEKDYEKLTVEVEILVQELEYIMSQNSKKSIDTYFEKWFVISNTLYVNIFQSNYDKDLQNIDSSPKLINNSYNRAKKFYEDILGFHARLIISATKNYDHTTLKYFLIDSFINALPYKPDSDSLEKNYVEKQKNIYIENVNNFKESFFKEQLKLMIDLIKQDDIDLFNKFKDRLNDNSENLLNKYLKENKIQDDYENLFLSLIHKMIDSDNSENISLIISLLMKIPNQIKYETKNVDVFLQNNKKIDSKDEFFEQINSVKQVLSENAVKGIYFAIIKANELELYKVSGYLIKMIVANIEFNTFLDITREIKMDYNKNSQSIHYENSISQTKFNDISFQYCFSKTFVLIYCQFLFRAPNIEDKDKLSLLNYKITLPKNLENISEFEYFLKKIENKQKEYNMISLINAHKNYKNFAKRNIYKVESKGIKKNTLEELIYIIKYIIK